MKNRGGRSMLGAIAGDVIGSAYEANPVKSTDFELFPPGSLYWGRDALDER